MTVSRAEQILDIAEREMRRGGIDAVSFRDIASAIGVKSASIHYYYPTKADLCRSVTSRYADRFIGALGSAAEEGETPKERIERLSAAYMDAFNQDASTCLCVVLGSVTGHLPEETSTEIQRFYSRLKGWVEEASDGSKMTLTANSVISLLQGAMALAIATDSDTPLKEASKDLLSPALWRDA